jgi:hypothetical protein
MLRAIVEAMRRSTRRALADARAGRRRQARAILGGLYRHRVSILGRLHALRAPPPADNTGAGALPVRVIAILEAHPDGIGAREIGNELGIDWRRVTAVMTSLVARGAADQIDQHFYPGGKASRKC